MSSNFVKDAPVKTVGFIVNPIAGMGGAVGLKGTDGTAILERAIVLGAKPIAPARAESFLSEFKLAKRRIRLIVGAGRMGEDEARNRGFTFTVLGDRKKETTAEDTIDVAKKVVQELQEGKSEYEPFLLYKQFADFSINFTVIFRVHEYVNKFKARHEFIKRLHKRYKQEGIEIPFPIRTVHLKHEKGDSPL